VTEQHREPSSGRLQTVAVWAEIAAAIAVVASLAFVGFQIRQATAETALDTRVAPGRRLPAPLRVEVMADPLGRSIWDSMTGSLVPGFVEYVDSVFAGSAPASTR